MAPNVLLIPGTSSVAHLEENVAVAESNSTTQTRERLDAVAAYAGPFRDRPTMPPRAPQIYTPVCAAIP